MKDCGGGLFVAAGESCGARICPSGAIAPAGEACPATTELPPLYRGPKPRQAVYLHPAKLDEEPWLDGRTNTVRVAVHDDGVDFTHPFFEGRIGEAGNFAYWHASSRDARFDLSFSGCYTRNSPGIGSTPCHVWVVDGKNSQEILQRHIRAVTAYVRKFRNSGYPRFSISAIRLPNDHFWVYDQRADRWYEIPPYGAVSYSSSRADHGTAVASVVLREAPDSTIVPFSLNFGPYET